MVGAQLKVVDRRERKRRRAGETSQPGRAVGRVSKFACLRLRRPVQGLLRIVKEEGGRRANAVAQLQAAKA